MRSVIPAFDPLSEDPLARLDAAGKSGTADFDGALNNATYVAFAPYSDPQVAVAVFMQPGSAGQTGLSGSDDARPVAAALLEASLAVVAAG
jgi:cell division protein FtsI/penicillin-binding protein 2